VSDRSNSSRPLPGRPSLRYLKIEAKQRLAAGEFTSLHEAQLAIAREHGFASWTALKTAIETTTGQPSHALEQVRWLAERFADADGPAWPAPDTAELAEHFDDRYLSLVPADTLISTLRPVAAQLRGDLAVGSATADSVRAQLTDLRVEAVTEPAPPHRLTRLRIYRLGARVSDPRVAAPATRVFGAVADNARAVAEESVAELGLPGLVLAGATRPELAPWMVARGWADLEHPENKLDQQRFPAYGVSKPVTAIAVLRLVAEGSVGLDEPANAFLRAIRLAEDDVTVRELLVHTAGVAGPAEMFADAVPENPLGVTVLCDRRRGEFVPGNGGYAVLGQLIADVAGESFTDAVTRLVLAPLRMRDSGFPARWPETGAITGYQLTDDGRFEPAPRQVCTVPAAGGLWSTATDLVRFGLEWASLLPGNLGAEAVRPQVAQDTPDAAVGFGWLVSAGRGIYGHPGTGPGAGVSLIVRPETGTVTVAATNRRVPVEPVNARLIRAIS
jgi:CubicO group peptidase (beta-lactamase class C family)